MNLYLISQTVNGGYDTYDSAVVAAASPEKAQLIHPATEEIGSKWDNLPLVYEGAWANKSEEVKVIYIGKAEKGIEAGVICASFNAG